MRNIEPRQDHSTSKLCQTYEQPHSSVFARFLLHLPITLPRLTRLIYVI